MPVGSSFMAGWVCLVAALSHCCLPNDTAVQLLPVSCLFLNMQQVQSSSNCDRHCHQAQVSSYWKACGVWNGYTTSQAAATSLVSALDSACAYSSFTSQVHAGPEVTVQRVTIAAALHTLCRAVYSCGCCVTCWTTGSRFYVVTTYFCHVHPEFLSQ